MYIYLLSTVFSSVYFPAWYTRAVAQLQGSNNKTMIVNTLHAVFDLMLDSLVIAATVASQFDRRFTGDYCN